MKEGFDILKENMHDSVGLLGEVTWDKYYIQSNRDFTMEPLDGINYTQLYCRGAPNPLDYYMAIQEIVKDMRYSVIHSVRKESPQPLTPGIIKYMEGSANTISAGGSGLSQYLIQEALSEITNEKRPITIFSNTRLLFHILNIFDVPTNHFILGATHKVEISDKLTWVYEPHLDNNTVLFLTMDEVAPVFTRDCGYICCVHEGSWFSNVSTYFALTFGDINSHAIITHLM